MTPYRQGNRCTFFQNQVKLYTPVEKRLWIQGEGDCIRETGVPFLQNQVKPDTPVEKRLWIQGECVCSGHCTEGGGPVAWCSTLQCRLGVKH